MSYLEENLSLKKPLRFKNKKFKILCISDLHGICNYDTRLTRDMEAILDGVKPDLLLVLGDMVWRDAMESEDNLRGFLKSVFKVVEDRKIPWAHVFGNHDNECNVNFSQQKVYEKFEYNLTKRGPEEIHGVGNFVLPIMNEKGDDVVYNVWGLDSHDSLGDFMKEFNLGDTSSKWDMQCVYPSCLHDWGSTYNTLNFDQVMWYWNSSVELEKHFGHRIPGLLCQHMALPEYVVTYKNTAESYYEGTRREGVGCPTLNAGMFNAILNRGDVKDVVVGHDHINDFTGKYMGIRLSCDAGLNYDGYCAEDMRGGRVYEIDEDNPDDVKTYMVRSSEFVENYPGECVRINDIK